MVVLVEEVVVGMLAAAAAVDTLEVVVEVVGMLAAAVADSHQRVA